MGSVEIENLTKVYGEGTVALDGISCEIDDGEFTVLLGPSGAGKSTLLRIINGLEEATNGQVKINGEEIDETTEDVGMVFQMHYLVEEISAFRNAMTGALGRSGFFNSLLDRFSREDRQEALRAFETVGLLDHADKRAVSLSGGQKQRVGIARALVQQPSLLLADEPVASLDPKAANEVMSYMARASAERNLTTIASLHQVNIARKYGDRFIGLRDGEIVFDGTRDDMTIDVIDDIYYSDVEESGDVNATDIGVEEVSGDV